MTTPESSPHYDVVCAYFVVPHWFQVHSTRLSTQAIRFFKKTLTKGKIKLLEDIIIQPLPTSLLETKINLWSLI